MNHDVKILIIDNQPKKSLALEALLEDFDCIIIRANLEDDPLRLMLEHEFALALLDIQMPEMKGIEVAELIRSSEIERHIPILFMTDVSKAQKYMFKGYDRGSVDYLFKPIEPIILRSKVNVFLRLYRQEKLLKQKDKELEKKLREILELQEINGKLLRLSNMDELTDIPNRRSFDAYIEICWKESIREQLPLSVIMIDIDYFKAYNDYYGHIKGDKCLMRVAQGIFSSLKRPRDLVARYGGEEFIIVLPYTNKEGVQQVTETIRKNIEQLSIPHQKSSVYPYVTISLGAAVTIPQKGDSIQSFIGCADKELYRAKFKGRNRVSIDSSTN